MPAGGRQQAERGGRAALARPLDPRESVSATLRLEPRTLWTLLRSAAIGRMGLQRLAQAGRRLPEPQRLPQFETRLVSSASSWDAARSNLIALLLSHIGRVYPRQLIKGLAAARVDRLQLRWDQRIARRGTWGGPARRQPARLGSLRLDRLLDFAAARVARAHWSAHSHLVQRQPRLGQSVDWTQPGYRLGCQHCWGLSHQAHGHQT